MSRALLQGRYLMTAWCRCLCKPRASLAFLTGAEGATRELIERLLGTTRKQGGISAGIGHLQPGCQGGSWRDSAPSAEIFSGAGTLEAQGSRRRID